MRLRLIRHATLVIELAGVRLLVDPQLDPAGTRPPVEGGADARRNPLCELPEPAEVVVARLDAVLVTHLHSDHFDATAAELVPNDLPLLCQPPDADALRDRGFTDVRPVAGVIEFDGIHVARTGGAHGTGAIGEEMGPVSGFVVSAPGEPVLYIAGDTIFGDEVRAALEEHDPDVVVVNAGGARLAHGGPITMTVDDVIAVARHSPRATVVAVHLEAIGHCAETRADLHQRLREENLTGRVTVPEDGAMIPLF